MGHRLTLARDVTIPAAPHWGRFIIGNRMSFEDNAQAHEAQEWAINNRAREFVVYKPGDPCYGPAECVKCGADMHPVRRGYGFGICTPCASAAEQRRR